MAYDPNQPYKPPQVQVPPGASPYAPVRQGIQQRFAQQGQEQNDAIQRKMAQLGNLNSGAAIKIQQNADEQLARQREEAIGNVDAQEAQGLQQQAFQAAEAQKARDLQQEQFGKTFGLEEKTKLGQLGLAEREMEMKRLEQEFNQATSAREQGYGIDLTQMLPTSFRDASGRLVNPNGMGMGYEQQQGIYSTPPDQAAMQRRMRYGRL